MQPEQSSNHSSLKIMISLSHRHLALSIPMLLEYQIIPFSELPYTIPFDTHLADSKIFIPEQI